jgi:hypothetical protein
MVVLPNKEIREFSENQSRYGIDAPTLYKGVATIGSCIGESGRTTIIWDDNI